jgi:acyl-CoA synthetase (AMP-forming)/AMP-acid ligase II
LATLLADLDCRVVSLQELESSREQPDPHGWPPPRAEQPAFVQYSSGTTGLQKGVVLSHRAILNNVSAIGQAVEIRGDDVVVSWLPLHHDMGLITGLMLPVLAGIPSVLLSPFQWVRDPKTLLQAIQDYRGTVSWMPNFAFNHCANSIRERDLSGLDLSRWRVLINAGEPVRLDSLRLFAGRFGPCGFRESALGAGYGMAEITGAVSITPIGRPPRVDWVQLRRLQEARRAEPAAAEQPGSTPLVSSGRLLAGVEVRIVDPAGGLLPERQIGEILVRSNSMLSGYRQRLDLTRAASREGWHATGDLGYLAEGDLFVTGRLNDLIITGGRNFFPEDLEAIASRVHGIRPGRAVAFGVEDAALGTEIIVLVCELREEVLPADRLAVERELRRRVAQELDVTLGAIRFVEKGWVIKTPSGKVARSANRDKFQRLTAAEAGAGAGPDASQVSRL